MDQEGGERDYKRKNREWGDICVNRKKAKQIVEDNIGREERMKEKWVRETIS